MIVVAVAAATNLVPPPHEKLAGATRAYVEAQCTTAALSAGDPKNAGIEVRRSGAAVTTRAALAELRVRDWYYGSAPGQYTAILDATRAGVAVHVRATVDLRKPACRLRGWAIGDGAVAVLTPLASTTPPSSGPGPVARVAPSPVTAKPKPPTAAPAKAPAESATATKPEKHKPKKA